MNLWFSNLPEVYPPKKKKFMNCHEIVLNLHKIIKWTIKASLTTMFLLLILSLKYINSLF